MIVGGYVLHLYCDYPDDGYEHRGGESSTGSGFGEFCKDTKRDTFKAARGSGWSFTKDGRCLCGWCAKQGRKLPKE